MTTGFIRATETAFQVDGRDVALRSMGIGSFLNLEFFMLGLYGTDADIRRCIRKLHGPEKADAFWSAYYEQFLNEADIRYLKELGLDSIRLPFSWRIFESEAGDGGFDARGFVQLDRIARLCERHGLRVILDLHSAPGGQNPDWHSDNPTGMALLWEFPELKRKTIALWERIAEHYRGDPWIGGYDLLNEPVIHPDRAGELDRFHHDLVAAIRRKDPDHLCLVEGNLYSSSFRPLTPIDDPNTAYSFHFYPFHRYLTLTAEELTRLDLAQELATLERHLVENEEGRHLREVLRRPCWCGETGTFYCAELGDVDFYLRAFRGAFGLLTKYAIPWCFWTYKDVGQHGLLRIREDSAWRTMAARIQGDVSYIQESRLLQREDERLAHRSFAVDDHTRHVLKRRTIADQQLIMTAKMEAVLAAIPFDDLLASVRGFHLDSCREQPDLARILRSATGRDRSAPGAA